MIFCLSCHLLLLEEPCVDFRVIFFSPRSQEFGTGQDAANAVAKYDQGTFLGEQIKVEISHGQGSRFKKDGEPPKLITCFNCKGEGHYAK